MVIDNIQRTVNFFAELFYEATKSINVITPFKLLILLNAGTFDKATETAHRAGKA